MNYTVSDFIIRIKNAVLARRRSMTMPYSRMIKEIAKVLIKEGFLTHVKEEVEDNKKTLVVQIAYHKRLAVFSDVKIISKPSLRVYVKAADNRRKQHGLATEVLSTSKGIMTGKEAVEKGVGGELLFMIW